jgi:hypothetical protein
MRRFLFSALALPLLAAAPPPSEVQPVREVLHGVEVVDPYRWLEGSAAPEMAKPDPQLDARVSAWTDAQNAYARSVLDNLPGRKELEARIKALNAKGDKRLFYFEQAADHPPNSLLSKSTMSYTLPEVPRDRRSMEAPRCNFTSWSTRSDTSPSPRRRRSDPSSTSS